MESSGFGTAPALALPWTSTASIVGGGRPIVVQSMTNTDTADADATAIQVARLAHAGSELVRITVNNEAAAAAVPEIVRKVRGLGAAVPIVGDFHYNGHKLLRRLPRDGAGAGQVPHQSRQRRARAGTTTTTSRPSSAWRSTTASRSGSASTGARWIRPSWPR